jgi:uncharacterized LabA/DUF88 family protein
MSRPQPRHKTYAYIDGFNFYYGCFRNRQRPAWAKYKWLDLQAFCDRLLPKNDVVAIKYYTADVTSRPPDNQGDRQKAYLTALSQLSKLTIIKGHFLGPKVVRMPECDSQGNYLGRTVTVLKTEEKGSDVNLAVDLIRDCIQGLYDCAVIISNDSDLIYPIKILRSEYGKIVGWVNPQTKPSVELARNTDFRIRLTESLLRECQFPQIVQVGRSSISKPSTW